MKSMTGYGHAEAADGRFAVSVEIKSWNNRYLDLVLSQPPALSPLESRIRDTIRERISRGRVECFVRFRDNQESLQISLDSANALAYKNVLDELRVLAGIAEPVRLEHLLSVEGLVRVDRPRDIDLYWEALRPVLERAVAALDESRAREGEALLVDLLAQLDRVGRQVDLIEAQVPRIEAQVRNGLRQRFLDVLGDQVEEQRFLAEVAVQLMRYTVNEEMVRLRAHLASARALMKGSEASGKKLDFICQEMNREINTIGSKNIILEIGEAVIEAKDALENIREQIRNAE